jgi:host factor-I protein
MKGRLSMTRSQNLQDTFLNQARKTAMPLIVFLVNGFQLRGIATGFDSFTLVLDTEGKQQLIYKHAISTIVPAKPIALGEHGVDAQ